MRQPIERERRSMQLPRERVWSAIRRLKKGFSISSVQDACEPMVMFGTVRDYMRALEAAGKIRRVVDSTPVSGHGAMRTTPLFDLTCKDYEAPRLLRNGTPVTQGLATEAMWRCMRVLKTWSPQQLSDAATLGDCVVPVQTVKAYIKHLSRAGYLQVVVPSKPGTQAVYRLVRNTGPHAPAVTRAKVVFDRNVGQAVELQSAQEVCDGLE